MTENTKMYWVHAMTPLHIGSGKGVGFIDMPIMREKVTNWPIVPGSAMKGVLRDHFEYHGDEDQKKNVPYAFGQRNSEDNTPAGSLVFTDARIVCMPIRSLYGTFAYITSPMVLERLKKDLMAAGCREIPSLDFRPTDEQVFHAAGSEIVSEGRVFFEDLDFTATMDPNASAWAALLAKFLFGTDNGWVNIFTKRFTVLSDDCFNFLAETGTEVAAHIRIENEKKIVARGALWYEESLPVETILAGIVWCDRIQGKNGSRPEMLLQCYCKDSLTLQVGGKATVGKGRIQCLFSGG